MTRRYAAGLLALVLVVLAGTPASAHHGPVHVEAEGTACTGGFVVDHIGSSFRQTSDASQQIDCTVDVVTGPGRVQLYGYLDAADRAYEYRLDAGAWVTKRPALGDGTAHQLLVDFDGVPAGLHTLSLRRLGDNPLLNYLTVTAGSAVVDNTSSTTTTDTTTASSPTYDGPRITGTDNGHGQRFVHATASVTVGFFTVLGALVVVLGFIREIAT